MNAFAYQKQETILSIQNVTLVLGDALILRNVCADVQDIIRPGLTQGQVVGFLGPSGIGKTQLSRIIAGLQKPTEGKVVLENKEVQKGDVGMVAQSYILFDWATVHENLAIAGRQYGYTKQQSEELMNGYIETFDLKKYLFMYPAQLSGGTRQRVAIVQQLMCSGEVLIMDEPFSGLDLIMKQRACELITKVASLNERNTIIVITHDVTEAASIADTLWLLGYEKDPEGALIPGARIVKQYDLAEMGFAWHPDIQSAPEFRDLVGDIKSKFKTLRG